MIANSRVGTARAASASLTFFLAMLCAPVAAADAERGGKLYETRCQACHTSSVHNRGARKAKSFDEIRAQVLRWSAEAGGNWDADEINDVIVYLNQRYYHFPCPTTMCKANQAALAR